MTGKKKSQTHYDIDNDNDSCKAFVIKVLQSDMILLDPVSEIALRSNNVQIDEIELNFLKYCPVFNLCRKFGVDC